MDNKELDKQGEPVAWMEADSPELYVCDRKTGKYTIPLYTAPQTKPLSDEEITEILIQKAIWIRLKAGGLASFQEDADLHDFARAIEERHGIK